MYHEFKSLFGLSTSLFLVKHEIRDLQILEIFEFKTFKFSTKKLKSSKVLPDLISEYLDQITLK
jgi:hypothetical protein